MNVPCTNQIKDGTDYCEYHEEEIQDNVYMAVLKQGYLMYRLFSGTYESTIESGNVEVLQNKLEHFYSAVRTKKKSQK